MASSASIDNEGILITPRDEVDTMEVDDSSIEIRTNLTIVIVSPNVREFLL